MSGTLQSLIIFFGTLLLIATLFTHRLIPDDEAELSPSPPTTKTYRTLLAKGVSIQTGAHPGPPLLCFDSCQVEKRAIHGFSLGGVNTLRIEQLEVTIPRQPRRPEALSGSTETSAEQSPLDSLCDLKIQDLFHISRPFSSVEIDGLAVYTGNSLKERVSLIESRSATSQLNRCILLKQCRVRTVSGHYVAAGKAWLSLDRPIRVTSETWAVNLEDQLAL